MPSGVFEQTFGGLSTPSSPDGSHTIARPKLSSIFAGGDEYGWHPKDAGDVEHEQRLSRELQGVEDYLHPTSAPERKDSYVFALPLSASASLGDVSQTDLSMSPAALFLSSFSPSAPSVSSPDAEGAVVSGYQLGPVIGVGGFSTIRAATSSQGGTVAIKIVRRSELSKQADPTLARKRLDREAAVWTSLSHEHVLPLFSVTQTLHADYFVTLYCPAGSLFDILKRDGRPGLAQDEAGMMFRQVVRGLRYLHEVAEVVHGDMKLENVLVDEMGVCKITDFGMARKIGERESEDDDESRESVEKDEGARQRKPRGNTLINPRRSYGKQSAIPMHLSVMRHQSGPRHRNSSPLPASSVSSPTLSSRIQPGSLPYAAPELLLPPPSVPYIPHPAQDIWALGVMLYTLLTGRLPFVDSFDPRLQMKILHGVYDLPEGISRGAERVLRCCLERSVPSRWTVAVVDDYAWCVGSHEAIDMSSPPKGPFSSRSRLASQLDSAAVDDDEGHRSLSRATRSTSRSPSSARQSVSRHPHHPYEPQHRHHEHHPRETVHVHPVPTEPTFSALTHAILRTESMSSDSSSPSESAVLMTPSGLRDPERERGRPPRSKSHWLTQEPLPNSRSISPLEMPPTPQGTDGVDADADMCKLETFDPEHVTSSVDAFASASHFSSNAMKSMRRSSDNSVEGPRPGPRPLSARERLRNVLRRDKLRSARSGSMPPAPASSHSWCPSDALTYSSAATPKPILRQTHSARSRSVDFGTDCGTLQRFGRMS